MVHVVLLVRYRALTDHANSQLIIDNVFIGDFQSVTGYYMQGAGRLVTPEISWLSPDFSWSDRFWR